MLIIGGSSRVDQWHYVNKKDNPVDLTSRGTKVGQQRETEHVVQVWLLATFTKSGYK